jgi:hypothetical protein
VAALAGGGFLYYQSEQEAAAQRKKVQAEIARIKAETKAARSNMKADRERYERLVAASQEKVADKIEINKIPAPQYADDPSQLLSRCSGIIATRLKDPDSLVVRSSWVTPPKDGKTSVYMNISATNSYGGRVTSLATCSFAKGQYVSSYIFN